MKCSFSENWEWLPTTDGGERLKNAMTTVVSTLSSPSFECSFAGKNEGRFPPVKRHNWEIFLQEFFSSFKARIEEFSLSLSFLPRDDTKSASPFLANARINRESAFLPFSFFARVRVSVLCGEFRINVSHA